MNLTTAYNNLQDFTRGSRINQFEDMVYGNRDYDYAVAGLAGQLAKFRGNGIHGTDIGKLPSHPTFSNESIYSNVQQPGGQWGMLNGEQVFIPSEVNLQNMGAKGLAKYFDKYEPNASLVLPAQYMLQGKEVH